MTFNLNKKMVDKESLLQQISDIDIYNMYLTEPLSLKTLIKSPLREESNPSFGFFIGERSEICFKDFVLGSGDCIKFVQLKFGLDYFEAMSKIVVDAKLTNDFIIKNMTPSTNINNNKSTIDRKELIAKNNIKLSKKSRKFEAHDLAFWNGFGITHQILLRYNVSALSHIFLGDKIIVADKYSYCFTEYKDGVETYKIYQPYNTSFKWLNTHNSSVWQGWSQLPRSGETLVITKSLKDVMAITAICKLPAISLQAESVNPKYHIIEQLRNRFSFIYLLYDNDYDKDVNWGREFGKKLASEFKFIRIEIEDKLKSKDFSDLVKKEGKDFAKEYLLDLTAVPF